MHCSFFILLYGVLSINGYPIYDDDIEHGGGFQEYYNIPDTADPIRIPRSLESVIKKTSKGAITIARDFIRTFLPSAAQLGYQGVRRMVKRNAPVSAVPVKSFPIPLKNVAPAIPAVNSYYNYQYPGFGLASYYSGYGGYPYSSYQNPYYGSNVYTPQYDVSKRTYMPYAYTNTYYNQMPITQQQQTQYQYPTSIAAYTAVKQSIANPDPPVTHGQDHTHHGPIPDTSTASGISQGLIDLENDVNGFNQAIQYMKEAFVKENANGGSDFQENLHTDKNDEIGEKKDLIKKEKTSKELIDAFRRTLDSKEKLENKLVSYFTNYVCGDDC